MDKFELVRKAGTSAKSFELTTNQIVEILNHWDELFGIDIAEATEDSVVVRFNGLPDDLDELIAEIYEFAPDIVDQGFECFPDALANPKFLDEETMTDIRELSEGIDFSDENYAFEILRKAIQRDQSIALWWE